MAKNENVIYLEIPCSTQFVCVARRAAEVISMGTSMTDEQIEDIKLAVGEACTNAVKYSDPQDSRVQVIYRLEKDTLEIEVRNKGRAFRHTIGSRPPVEELPVGGLGLFLINEIMDGLDINSRSGETSVKMRKKLAPVK